MRTSICVKKPLLPLLSTAPSLSGVEHPERLADAGGAAVTRPAEELWRRGEQYRPTFALSTSAMEWPGSLQLVRRGEG